MKNKNRAKNKLLVLVWHRLRGWRVNETLRVRAGVSPWRRRWRIGAVVFMLAGVYGLTLVVSPAMLLGSASKQLPSIKTGDTVTTWPERTDDRLYIPRIGVDIAFKTGDASTLNDYAWHRKPELGDPERGGNFILSGHRFEVGLTPGQTKTKSPFYHIDRLQPGDFIYVDFHQKRYAYKIQRIYDVPNDQIDIENPSATPKLTLYTCNIRGESYGRVVVEAVPNTAL